MTIKIIASEAARKLSAEEKWQILGPYLKEHGRGCLAYSTLQDLDYFIDENRGYMAYSPFKHSIFSRNGKKYVLADPITARSDYQNIIESFLTKNPDSVFIQVTRSVAEILAAFGFEVNQLGIETEIELNGFSTKGAARGGGPQNLDSVLSSDSDPEGRIRDEQETQKAQCPIQG